MYVILQLPVSCGIHPLKEIEHLSQMVWILCTGSVVYNLVLGWWSVRLFVFMVVAGPVLGGCWGGDLLRHGPWLGCCGDSLQTETNIYIVFVHVLLMFILSHATVPLRRYQLRYRGHRIGSNMEDEDILYTFYYE